nr:aspartate aminotransferase family protein [Nitrososphaeria archaeon]
MSYSGLNTSRSKELYKMACELVPGGVGSHAQGYPYFDPYPLFLERGRGSKFWDVDENEFIDYAL